MPKFAALTIALTLAACAEAPEGPADVSRTETLHPMHGFSVFLPGS